MHDRQDVPCSGGLRSTGRIGNRPLTFDRMRRYDSDL